ncbi:unnamed protein product [Brassicogethes aeneus]|uniref:Uncharacterized protein n=1 Tax=Brassicogethes aeneus TaxID=1431903 RepID=A0A9P0AVP6_BRAAE|nr:unnamed protein product [Brassicogethes aeneus]
METLKKQANKAFRREEYEKALTLYTKALDLIRDSVVLYNNRALTYIKLKLYEKALPDLNWALRLNEDCLKSWLLLAKANFYLENLTEFDKAIKEAMERNPNHKDYINEFVDDLKMKND